MVTERVRALREAVLSLSGALAQCKGVSTFFTVRALLVSPRVERVGTLQITEWTVDYGVGLRRPPQ